LDRRHPMPSARTEVAVAEVGGKALHHAVAVGWAFARKISEIQTKSPRRSFLTGHDAA
jgi:hypothetical protein